MPKNNMKKRSKQHMSKSTKSSNKFDKNTETFIKTQILQLLLNFGLFLVSVALCLKLDFSRKNIFYVAIAIFAVGAFVAAFYAGYKIHKNGLVIGLIFTLPINAILIFISCACNGFSVDLTALISFFILSVSAMLAGISSVNVQLKAKR